jgi:arylsulfatase A-like enzyme
MSLDQCDVADRPNRRDTTDRPQTDGGRRPNVLLVHCHDIGRYLGCYGHDVDTPALDAFAAESAQFEEYYCPAPQCGPSRASIMTGQYPHNHGLMGHHWLGWELEEGVETMPAILQDAGYETNVLGISHEGPDATTLGYDVEHECSARARDVVPTFLEHLDERDGDAPVYASLGFREPHRLGIDHGFGFDSDRYGAADPDTVDVPAYLPDTDPVREELANFHGMVEAVDEAFADLLVGLEDRGLADETMVLFTADHGVAFPRAKGMCYDPGIETALLVRHPDVPADRHDSLLSNVDLLPTLCDFLGLADPAPVDGRSFAPLLEEGADAPDIGAYEEREEIFCEMTFHDKYDPKRAVRTDRYKYVRNFGDLPKVYLPLDILHSKMGFEVVHEYYAEARPEEELYDLREDPHERENRIDDAEYETVARRLRSRVEEWMTETDDVLLDGEVPVPEEHVDVLKTYPW